MYKIGQVIKFYVKDTEWLSNPKTTHYSENYIECSSILGIKDGKALVYITEGCYGFISLDKVLKESRKIKVWRPHKNRPTFKFKLNTFDHCWEYKFDNFELSIYFHDDEYVCRLFDSERNVIVTSGYQSSKSKALGEMIFVARQGEYFIVHLQDLLK